MAQPNLVGDVGLLDVQRARLEQLEPRGIERPFDLDGLTGDTLGIDPSILGNDGSAAEAATAARHTASIANQTAGPLTDPESLTRPATA